MGAQNSDPAQERRGTDAAPSGTSGARSQSEWDCFDVDRFPCPWWPVRGGL